MQMAGWLATCSGADVHDERLPRPIRLHVCLQLRKAFAEAERAAGPIDLLICNAGMSVPGAAACGAHGRWRS